MLRAYFKYETCTLPSFAPSHLFLPKYHSFLYASKNICVTMELTIPGNWSSGEFNWQKQLVSLREILSSSRKYASASKKEREVCSLWQTEGCETSFTISLRLHWLWNYNLRFHVLGYVFIFVLVLMAFETSGQLQVETQRRIPVPSTYTSFNDPSPIPFPPTSTLLPQIRNTNTCAVVRQTSLGRELILLRNK